MQNLHIKDSLSLNILSNNEDYISLEDSLKKDFAFENSPLNRVCPKILIHHFAHWTHVNIPFYKLLNSGTLCQ